MKIVWVSDGPRVQTGYGCQAAMALRKFRDDGHDVRIVARDMEGVNHEDWEGMPVYGRVAHPYGYDAVPYLFQDEKPDVAIFMHDLGPAITHPTEMEQHGFRWVPWYPVDTVTLSPVVASLARRAWDSMTYSKHGAAQAEAAGIPSHYVPLALADEFVPGDRSAARKKITDGRVPDDAFLFGFVGANQSGLLNRKGLAETLEAFAEVASGREGVFLLVHSIWKPIDGNEMRLDLEEYAHDLGILDRVIFSNDRRVKAGLYTNEDMADVYRALDCLVAPSISEGFGVPIIEAQACGVPVITCGWVSMPELVTNGWVIPVSSSEPLYVPGLSAWYRKPRVSAVGSRMVKALSEARSRRGKGANIVRSRYAIDRVWDTHWRPVIARWSERIAREEKSAA